MTTLKPAVERILKLFYEEKQLHLREIARRTKLQGQSITRYLNQLEKDHILTSTREGNLKKYSLQKNKKVYALRTLLDIQRLEHLPFLRKKALAHFLNKLPQQPVFVILFGSTAKGTYKEDSDIDLLLVTNNRISAEKAEKETNALTAMKTSTFQITYKDFLIDQKMKEDKVVQSAISSGYPLINHIQYYDVLYNERI